MLETAPIAGKSPQPRARIERETVIRYNEAEPLAILWTASLREVNKWLKLGLAVASESGGWRSQVEKSAIKLRSPFKRRTLSSEHKAALIRGRQAQHARETLSTEVLAEAQSHIFSLGQPFVSRATTTDGPEVSVIGADVNVELPTNGAKQ